jgi:hypothetical protein
MLTAPWSTWSQDDLPCLFSQGQALNNAAYLAQKLGERWLENGLANPGHENHPVFLRWSTAGANAFLELNSLAEDLRLLDTKPGFDSLLMDLRHTDRATSAWHTAHAAALFERAQPSAVTEFPLQKSALVPDFLLRVGGSTLACEAKFLAVSEKEQAFSVYAESVKELLFEEVLTGGEIYPSFVIVLKNSDHLPSLSLIREQLVKVWQDFHGSSMEARSPQLSVFVDPPGPTTQRFIRFKQCTVLSPRSEKEDLRVEARGKEAEKQLRPLSASTAGLACLAVGHPHNPHVVFNLLSRRFKAGRYPGLSGVELIRTATHLAPPVRTVIDLLALIQNPTSTSPLPRLQLRGLGILAPLLQMVHPDGPIPAYRFNEVLALGQPEVQVFMPDVRFLTPEMLL